MTQLHDFAKLALPHVLHLDAVCARVGYSQLKAYAQIAQESAWDAGACSSVGAIGLCQIMPDTADSWGVNPHDPDASITALVENMHAYEERFGSFELALAAYNAGEGAVSQTSPPSVPPYQETQQYVYLISESVANAKPYWPYFWGSLIEYAHAAEKAKKGHTHV